MNTASILVDVIKRALAIARAMRLRALPPRTFACVVCGSATTSLRACEGCGALVGYAPAGGALSMLPEPAASAVKIDGRKHRRCSRCGGDDGHDRRTCTATEQAAPLTRYALDRAAPPRKREPGSNPSTPLGGAHLACRCPGHDGTAADLAALATWIEHGCPLHDRPSRDRSAARRFVEYVAPAAPVDPDELDASEAA